MNINPFKLAGVFLLLLAGMMGGCSQGEQTPGVWKGGPRVLRAVLDQHPRIAILPLEMVILLRIPENPHRYTNFGEEVFI